MPPDKRRIAAEKVLTYIGTYLFIYSAIFSFTLSDLHSLKRCKFSMDTPTLEQLQAIDSRFTADITGAFEYETSVEAKSSKGVTSRSSVVEQIQVLGAMLDLEV